MYAHFHTSTVLRAVFSTRILSTEAALTKLPPATSQAPFVVLPSIQSFDFRVLRQNRRVVLDEGRKLELENFHEVLADISFGKASNVVRKFIVDSYVRGAAIRRPENVEFEGSTAVFTNRSQQTNRNLISRAWHGGMAARRHGLAAWLA